jgi:hypothetical protein
MELVVAKANLGELEKIPLLLCKKCGSSGQTSLPPKKEIVSFSRSGAKPGHGFIDRVKRSLAYGGGARIRDARAFNASRKIRREFSEITGGASQFEFQ